MEDYKHTIADIARMTGKTTQSIQKFRNKHAQELYPYTRKDGRFIYFNDDGLAVFLNHYQRKQPVANPVVMAASTETEHQDESQADKVAELEAQIVELRQQLANMEADKKIAQEQAGMALEALRREQATVERLTLALPAPENPASDGQPDKNTAESPAEQPAPTETPKKSRWRRLIEAWKGTN